MNYRNKRGRLGMRGRLAVAAAVLAGGGAAGVLAVAASNGSTAANAQSAGYTLRFHHTMNEPQALAAAISRWNGSSVSSLNTLASMRSMRTFSQVWHHHVMFAAQRGIVVLATPKFLVVRSAHGQLHLWWLTGQTKVKNVSASPAGMVALTGNNLAAHTAMLTGNMMPAATTMTGSLGLVNQLTTPTPKPTTVTINTGGQVITITISQSTATVMQPTLTTPTTMLTQPVFTAAKGVARGDLVFVAGVRVHGKLFAKIVLFAPPKTAMPTASAMPTTTIAPTLGATPTATPTITQNTVTAPAGNGTPTFTGPHS